MDLNKFGIQVTDLVFDQDRLPNEKVGPNPFVSIANKDAVKISESYASKQHNSNPFTVEKL